VRKNSNHNNQNNNKNNNKQNSANSSAKVQWKGNRSDNTIIGGKNSEKFTAEEDSRLWDLKTQALEENTNLSWEKIATELNTGKNGNQCKGRYNELRESKCDGGDKKTNNEKRAIGEQKKAENLAKQENGGKGEKKKGKGKGDDDGDSVGNRKNNNSKANKDIKTWASKFEERKWTMAAARHFDKTGERLSAEEARRMAEE
jgi:hypothetical protein